MKISPARTAAFDVLLRIVRDEAFSSILLPQYESELEISDRGLCHEIVMGVLRRQLYLDRLIETISGKGKLDLEVRTALRIGLFQMMYLDKVPAFSAVNESVNLVQRAKKTSAKGLVNAVLRKASKGIPELSFADTVDRISTETSHPRWLVEKWINDFGEHDAEAIMDANNQPPALVFRRTLKGSAVNMNLLGRPSQVAENAYNADGFNALLRDAAAQYHVYFQDAGSQMVANAVDLKPGERFVDVCAAPGSKTTYVATFSKDPFIIAGDLSRQRVDHLLKNCREQGAAFVNVCQYNACQPLPFADETFDVVLVDAPCSGTGTIRHNPEIRYFLKPKDFSELSLKQLEILTNASKLVRFGGRLIYSTCSLEIEENESVAKGFIRENTAFSVAGSPVTNRFTTPEGFARTFPHLHETDGFFIAQFRRIE
jgi:16S rRNA (cytosine967-C5)-methyltransferase